MTRNRYLYCGEMKSPLGLVTILSTEQGVCRLYFGSLSDSDCSLKEWAKKTFLAKDIICDQDRHKDIMKQLQEYFQGKRELFTFPLDIHGGTPFQRKVWTELSNIVYGQTSTYKSMAQAIEAPKAVRAVGGAVNRNPIPIIIPCHRVIGSSGSLIGYNGGLDKKEYLLTIENAIEQIS